MIVRKVLIIENDATAQAAIRQTVERSEVPWQCEFVVALGNARAKIATQPWDGVVLKVELATDDGATFCAELDRQGIPLIALATIGQEDAVLELMQQGASSYLIQDPDCRYLKLLPMTLQRAIASRPPNQQPNTAAPAFNPQPIDFQASLLEQVRNAVIATNLKGQIIYWNHHAEIIYHWTAAEALGRNINEVLVPVEPDRLACGILPTITTQGYWEGEVEIYRRDGEIVPIQIVDTLMWNKQGTVIGYITVSSDIRDRRRMEAERQRQENLLTGQRHILELLVLDTPLSEILDGLLRMIETQAQGMLGSILLLKDEHLSHGAAPSLPPDYIQAIDGVKIGDQVGSCGTAAFRQEPVVVVDIATDPLWENYRHIALQHGLRACWSVPIFSRRGDVLGTFALYHHEPHTPLPQDWKLVRVGVNLAALAIERKQTEIALSQSEERFRMTFEQAAIGICHVARNGQLLRFNQRFCEISGYTAAELQTLTFQEITHPDDLPADLLRLQRLLKGALSTYTAEKRYIRKDRTIIWVNLTASLVRNPAGEPSYVIGVVEDITARKQAESDLRRSEQRYTSLAEAAPVGIFRTDSNGHCLYVNDRWCQIAGLKPDQALGVGWMGALHSRDRENVFAEWSRATQSQQPFRLEYRFQRSDGTISWVFGQAVAEYTTDGAIAGYVGTITDITDRKQAEAALHQLNQELELRVEQRTAELQQINYQLQQSIAERQTLASLVENSTDFIATAALNGQMTYLNQAGRQLVGLDTTTDITHYTIADYHFGADWEALQQTALAALARGKSWQGEVRLRHFQTGVAIPMMHSAFPIKHPETGEVLALAGILRDISAWKQIEQQLRDLSDRLTLALRSGKIGTWEWDLVTDVVIWDERMYALYGLSRSDFPNIYDGWLHTVHPDDRTEADQIAQQARQGEREYNTEFRVIHANGSIHFLQAFALIQRDPAGMPRRMIGINYDITDRKLAEAALQASEERYRQMVETQTDFVMRSLPDMTITFANVSFCEAFGHFPDQVMGKSWREFVPPKDINCLEQKIAALTLTQPTFENINSNYRTNGQIGWTQWINRGIFNQQGELLEIQSVGRDITQLRQTEEALRASETRFRNYFEQSLVGKAITSPEKGWIEVNDKLCDILGYPRAELTQLTWAELTHPDDLATDVANFNRVLTGETDGYAMDKRFIRKDGTVIYASISARCLRKDDGSVDYFVALVEDITARKQAEEKLRESQSSLLEAQRVAHIGNWVFEPQTQTITWSEELYKMFGLDPTQPVPSYENYLSRIHPHDRAALVQGLETTLAEGTPYTIDYQVIMPDGSIRYHEGRGEAVCDQQGQVIKLLGTALDITERKQTELELRRNRDLRDAIFNQSTDALFLVDSTTEQIIDCNERAIEMFEADRKDDLLHISDNILQLYPFSPTELATIFATVKPAGFWSREIEYVTRKGRCFWANIAGTTVTVADEPIRLVRLSDITVRKQMELLLHQQLEKEQLLVSVLTRIRDSLDLKAILQVAVDEVRDLIQSDRVLVYQLHDDGSGLAVAESVNEPWRHILNVSFSSEAFPPTCYQRYVQGTTYIINDRDQELVLGCMVQFMATFQIRAKLVVPIVQQENKKLWGLLIAHECAAPRQWESWEIGLLQQLAGQLAIAIQQADLYQQVQAELVERQRAETILQETNEQLQLANMDLARATRLKDEFLANMSHELRTPLNAILGMAEVLEERILGEINDQQQKAIATIEHSGRHLLDLINDILDLAKIEAGKLELHLAPCSVQHLCHSSLNLVKQLAYKKDIQLNVTIAPQMGQIEVDERRLLQVLINLLTNAIKFTPSGGSVTLEVWRQTILPNRQEANQQPATPQSTICFAVIDTGIGIAADDRPKLFQSFVQIDSKLNRQYSGTGLGLALVKRVTELHGGSVTVESQPGQGSRFTVILPDHLAFQTGPMPVIPAITTAPADPSESAATEANAPPTLSPLILLVEDNPANIETYSNYLIFFDYRLIIATNGREAVAMANQHQPALILMDIQMPEMDGLEAIRQMRTTPALAHTPIIALTALAMPSDRDRCLEVGANVYLAKPIRLRQLVDAIAQLLQSE